MAPLLNTPGLQLRKLSLVSVTPDDIDVFSLRSHRVRSQIDVLLVPSLNEMRRNEGAVPVILCRALHAGRTALIG